MAIGMLGLEVEVVNDIVSTLCVCVDSEEALVNVVS